MNGPLVLSEAAPGLVFSRRRLEGAERHTRASERPIGLCGAVTSPSSRFQLLQDFCDLSLLSGS